MRFRNLLLFSGITFIFFLLFTYFVSKELWTQFDFDSMVKLQNKIPRGLDPFLSIFSFLGNAEITVGFTVLLSAVAFTRKKFLVALGWLGIIPATLIEVSGKLLIYHPSPSIEFLRTLKTTHLPAFYIHTDYSYPSGHVTRTTFLVTIFLIMVILSWKNINAKIIASVGLILFLFIMILSRVSLGEHWLSDVLGGLLLGAAVGFLSSALILSKKYLKG